MRIVIDMQGAQTESRFRGIGRYTISFAQAVVRNCDKHEVILALSGLFPETIEPIRAAFDGLLTQDKIRVWHAPGPVNESDDVNDSRREAAELLREDFFRKLEPDIVHVCSLFEGFGDNAATSISRFDDRTPISVTLHDLIPLSNPNEYLLPNPRYHKHYLRKIEFLKRAATYLAVSEFSRQEGIQALGRDSKIFVNTLEAIEPQFEAKLVSAAATTQLKQKFGIRHPFLLYTGGADERKNLPRLINAYAALPVSLRDCHQMVFAGKMPNGNIAFLKSVAQLAGLKDEDIQFTGYVTDEELVHLYNLCRLYIFPSWHEGFGLPALEAMACGAPVIAANSSSLPEVIGWLEALFDPYDVTAISLKIARALEDEEFRSQLIRNGIKQAKRFSWDKTAQCALKAWESLPRRSVSAADYHARTHAYERLLSEVAGNIDPKDTSIAIAIASCITQNERASVERQLFLDVSELCQRDAATGIQRVVRNYLKCLLESPPDGFRIEPVYATQDEGYRYARRFTSRFLNQQEAQVSDSPMRWQRGDLFFGLDMQHHVQLKHAAFYRQIQSEGVTVKFLVYDLLPIQLPHLFKDSNAKALHEQWLAMVASCDGALCISKATADAYTAWVAEQNVAQSRGFKVRHVHIGADFNGATPPQRLPDGSSVVLATLRRRPTFLCVSTLEPRKQQQQILDAVEQLWLQGLDVNLAFVGQQGWKVEALAERLRTHPESGCRLFWLEGISDDYLEQVYSASTCLIAASLNEGFGLSLIEAAKHGIPIIARDIPIFREVAGDHAYYFRGEAARDLADAFKIWLVNYSRKQHVPSADMPWLTWQRSTEMLKTALLEQPLPQRQLLVDISELVQHDAKTGIQRVVRNILREWLCNPPQGYCVVPVYATVDDGYRYARQFTQRFIGKFEELRTDELIDYTPGDVFFGLDLQPQIQIAQRHFYQTLRQQGIDVQFLVHDLLCVQMPQYFLPGSAEGFALWLEVVAENNGAICVSQTTASHLEKWIQNNHPARIRALKIGWSHNGTDADDFEPSKGLPAEANAILTNLKTKPTFLMVGTLEPRKGHLDVIDAMDELWQSNFDINLVIVGKAGWMVDELVMRLRHHGEKGRHLFWLEDISDEYLDQVYISSTCLIAASYGEGFGLPLVEAAQHKLPVIARDIAVFREVAGEHAFYFQTEKVDEFAKIISVWLELYMKNGHPKSDKMKWLTWKESAEHLWSSSRSN